MDWSPEGDQSWVFIGGTVAEAETSILWPSDAKSWLIGKDFDAGRDWRQEEKGMTGWDGCMASPTRWTWIWVNSWSWWWTGRPSVLWLMGSQRVGHNWVTGLNWTGLDWSPPGSSVHGISQAKILEWVAVCFSRRSPQPKDWTQVSSTGRWIL